MISKFDINCCFSFIDVLTADKIIEVKQEHNWKHALGQVKCYGFYYPNKEK